MNIAFVTSREQPAITVDDERCAAILRERGHAVVAAPWDQSGSDWSAFDLAVLRSTWNYHLVPQEFLAWLDELDATRARVLNPTALVRWNTDKYYLQELVQRGAPVIPTHFVQPGETLGEITAKHGWRDAVVKPRVSASAYRTWRAPRESAEADESYFAEEAAAVPLLVQQYVPAIATEGEISFIFFDGAFSHAVQKRPAHGDFRVQEELGGATTAYAASTREIAQADSVLDLIDERYLYARVDGCVVEGRLRVMEVELVEPSLFLEHDLQAPRRFADAIESAARRLNR